LLDYLVDEESGQSGGKATTVGDIMVKEPISVTPDTSTLEAVKLMRQQNIGALPVVQDGHLVGIVTESDFMQIAEQLMEHLVAREEK
jgi:CBS domain-containing protein